MSGYEESLNKTTLSFIPQQYIKLANTRFSNATRLSVTYQKEYYYEL